MFANKYKKIPTNVKIQKILAFIQNEADFLKPFSSCRGEAKTGKQHLTPKTLLTIHWFTIIYTVPLCSDELY